jgi:3'(2'), 5'-bisphosphate nucleotidase
MSQLTISSLCRPLKPIQPFHIEAMFDPDALLHIAVKAALAAGKAIMEVYESNDFQVTSKDDDSPLTLADRRAHSVISDLLKETMLPVLSEEGKHIGYELRKDRDYFWLVDPLDGTKEFIKRNGEFTVNIALIKKDTPIAGVIYVPVTKTLYFSGVNTNAYKIDGVKEETVSDFQELRTLACQLPLPKTNRPYTVVGSRSHLSEETQEFIEKLKAKKGEIEFLSVGSSLKQCMIAEGKADLYPRFGPTMEWDTGAGHAIVKAAFGSVTQMDGKPLVYNKPNLLNPDFIVKGRNC